VVEDKIDEIGKSRFFMRRTSVSMIFDMEGVHVLEQEKVFLEESLKGWDRRRKWDFIFD